MSERTGETPSRRANDADLVRRYGRIGISAVEACARYAPSSDVKGDAPQGDKMVQEPAETD
jgi:hypothetical protein